MALILQASCRTLHGKHSLHHNYATQLAGFCSEVRPFPVSAPKLAIKNIELANSLNIGHLFNDEHRLINALFSSNGELQTKSVAQKYGGHQFGQWNPQLGDGRGLLLGEIKTQQGKLIDLHLKGAGPTPYSRQADGRAVLRSTIREYLASEALHYLGIPSSRALALISSDEPIVREQIEKGAMMIRTCPSHIRFGHFEYFYHENMLKELDSLFEFCFEHQFQHLANAQNPYLALLSEICRDTAVLVAKWQAYGFNHGVMNTDNMSIHGITFDFGPYAFLDDFIPTYICNKTDHSGRYAFNQQPSIALWNLNALANSFSKKLNIEQLKQVLGIFEPTFLAAYKNEIFRRFGFGGKHSGTEITSNNKRDHMLALSNRFMQLLADEYADYHQSFRHLSHAVDQIMDGNFKVLSHYFRERGAFEQWAKDYKQHLDQSDVNMHDLQSNMLATNPKYVLRNHLMQNAIRLANQDDFTMVKNLLVVTGRPFDEHPKFEELAQPPSKKEKGLALSCSS